MPQSLCRKRQGALASAIHRQVTKPRGFQKSGMTARRVIEGTPLGLLQMLNIQGSSGNVGSDCVVYINVGARLLVARSDPERMQWHSCPFGFRIVAQERTGGGFRDRWALTDHVDPAVVSVVEAQAGPWFDERQEPMAFLLRVEQEYCSGGIERWVGLVDHFCIVWAELGETDRVVEALRAKLDYFARERPHADPQLVHDFASSLGVEL